MSGAIHHEANGRAVLIPERKVYVIPAFAVRRPVLPSRRPAGHAPRATRHPTRSTTSNSTGDSSDGGSDSQDSSDGPASLPLIGGFRNNNNNPRKENNPKKQRKQTIVELSNRLELESAALMFCVLASLVLGCSR